MAINLRELPRDFRDTLSVYSELVSNRNGGGFTVQPTAVVAELPYQSAVRPTSLSDSNSDFKPFIISIYNQNEDIDRVSLALMVNPSDISIGQTFVSSDAYTREGWLSTLWGKGQMTINANCTTAAFYVGGVGVSTFLRNFSIAFKNFASFIGLFKNNGYYFFRGEENKGLFSSDPGRVINVMDQIKISYDDVEYLGSFSSLTIDENVENPYQILFNFEFVVSGLRGELAEGHLMVCDDLGCNNTSTYRINSQGSYTFEDIISIDRRSLSRTFPDPNPAPLDRLPSNQTNNYARIRASASRDNNELTLMLAGDLSGDGLGQPLTRSFLRNQNVYENVRQWYGEIEQAARRYGVDPWVVAAMIHQESAGVVNARSSAGARGLMQIMGPTGSDLGLTTVEQFYDGPTNINAGTRYISQQLRTFDNDINRALAAYNAGPGNVRKYNGVPPFRETQGYVGRITAELIPYYQADWERYQEEQANQD